MMKRAASIGPRLVAVAMFTVVQTLCALPRIDLNPGLAGEWDGHVFAPRGPGVQVHWTVRPDGTGFVVRHGEFTFHFRKGGLDTTGRTEFDFDVSLNHVGRINTGRCWLSRDGNRLDGEVLNGKVPARSGWRSVWTLTRNDARR